VSFTDSKKISRRSGLSVTRTINTFYVVHVSDLELLGDGAEAEIFAWPDDRVVRLMRAGIGSPALEQVAMRAVEGRVDIPTPGELVTIDGRLGLIMERIDGADFYSTLSRLPWASFHVFALMGRLHARLLSTPAPPELPDLHDYLRTQLEHPSVPPAARVAALEALDTLPTARAVCHGDFHPGNLLSDGTRTVVIDWSNATRGNPQADIARTDLLLRTTSNTELPPAARFVGGVGRSLLLRAYHRGVRQAGLPTDREQVRRWQIIRAAARFEERRPADEKARLRELLRRRGVEL